MPSPPQPLAGVRVVVTRAPHQAQETLDAFRRAGAEAAALPLMEVVPVDPEASAALRQAVLTAPSYSWLAFTSANAARWFLGWLTGGQHGGSPRTALETASDCVRIATVGGATATAVRELGFEVALVAEEPRAEGLLAVLLPHLQPGDRILLPQAADARPVLAEGLRAAGHAVTTATTYEKRLPPDAREQARDLFRNSPLGWVTFTSPRTVTAFVELMEDLLGEDWPRRKGELRALSIGPVTSDALRRHGIDPAAEAAEPSSAGLVAAIQMRS